MKIDDDALRSIWRQRSAGVAHDKSACLSEEDWSRLLSADLGRKERARAIEHIASCADCADEYRMLHPLQSWAADAERALSPTRPGLAARVSAWLWAPPRRLALATAAVALIVTNGATLLRLREVNDRAAQLQAELTAEKSTLSNALRNGTATRDELNAARDRLTQLSTPRLDVTVADLDPRVSDVRGGPARTVTIPPNTPAVTLVLNMPPLQSAATLEVQVEQTNGQIRWMGRTQREQDAAVLTLALPAEYPSGSYTIRIVDVTNGTRVLATYAIDLRRPDDPRR